MDNSYTESDVSLSPSRILERLQLLRQMQILQRGKLQNQQLQYQASPSDVSGLTELVSQFSNSTSYNTFRSLLLSPHDTSQEITPRQTSNLPSKLRENDLVEGVAVLNLSQESEFIVNSPISSKSRASTQSRTNVSSETNSCQVREKTHLKKISLDEMPILSPKKDFEQMLIEKLKSEQNSVKHKTVSKNNSILNPDKKVYLKRGQGMARFGLRKNDLVIQSTKALPWRQKNQNKNFKKIVNVKKNNPNNKNIDNITVEIMISQPGTPVQSKNTKDQIKLDKNQNKIDSQRNWDRSQNSPNSHDQHHNAACEMNNEPQMLPIQVPKINLPTGKHPLAENKGKSWASVLTKEQDDFLRQLKQSSYYKNFASPAKSTTSDVSCDETLLKLKQQREVAEQNMFELLERKVSNDSFCVENSFLSRFIKSKLEFSGDSTPLVMQRCLEKNPNLLHILPGLNGKSENSSCCSNSECNSEYTECCSDTCSSVSTCCSCNTVEEAHSESKTLFNKNNKRKTTNKTSEKSNKEVTSKSNDTNDKNDNIDSENIALKENMAEMNTKLIATSELLKERLHELEDEIETFRKENTNLAKMREDIELERKKFYEEKAAYEQKFNEEKILSEYYLAEEKEKLTKQKQMYDKYVREIRGRLNKKDKDEVVNLKKEISDLKEEIKLKDAKSTSTIARLRNQMKIMDKEKKDLQTEVEKLKKENRRIQHSNDITRRLTNLKYLEQINKKLNNMTSKETKSDVRLDSDVKYKAFEIDRQSRSKKAKCNVTQPVPKTKLRARTRSVPNLNVTSRYAKYFSQRDVISQVETNNYMSDYADLGANYNQTHSSNSEASQIEYDKDSSDNEEHENVLEKLYVDKFQSMSPKSNSNRSSAGTVDGDFFLTRTGMTSPNPISEMRSDSTYNTTNIRKSKSPASILSNRSSTNSKTYSNMDENVNTLNRTKSSSSIRSNVTAVGQKPASKRDHIDGDLALSPEPTSITKSKLNPTEIRKPDGSRELRFPNGNVKHLSADGKYSKFVYYNGDIKENFYNEGRIKYYYAESKTFHTTHADGLEVLEFPDGQVEKRYKDGSSEIHLPNGSVRYFDPKNEHVREEWRFPDGATLTVGAGGEQRIVFANGQVEVHAKDHKRREYPDGTVKLVYSDGTAETRYASGRVRIKDKHGHLIMDSAQG